MEAVTQEAALGGVKYLVTPSIPILRTNFRHILNNNMKKRMFVV